MSTPMNASAKRKLEKALAVSLLRNSVGLDAKIVVGLSGGADSVALLCGLMALKSAGSLNETIAAHLNHGLRGAEADRDEVFVRGLCARIGVELVVERAEGLTRRKGNLEERARLYRHDFLNRVAERFGAGYVALAHHADDQAETVLLRLMRGSGITGASAMAEAGPGRLLRPLLRVRRDDILSYLAEIGMAYVTDSSNLHGANARSQVRNQLIPLIERTYAPGMTVRLNEFARELRSTADFMTASAIAELRRRSDPEGRLNLAGLASLHPALIAATLRELLRERLGDLRSVNRAHIEGMRALCFDGPSNGVCALPGGWRLRREYNSAVIERVPARTPQPFDVRIANGTVTTVAAAGFAFDADLVPTDSQEGWINGYGLRTESMETMFDADRVGAYLSIRNFRHGDRLRPLGMAGSRKIQDLFVDRKLPRERRQSWPLVVAGDGEILWIPGMARSRAALVTTATRRVLNLRARALVPDLDNCVA
jgi:tRNA(Ile)-lysidine synthase